MFGNIFQVDRRRKFGRQITARIPEADLAVIQLESSLCIHQAHIAGREGGKAAGQFAVSVKPLFDEIHAFPCKIKVLTPFRGNNVAILEGQRRIDAAGTAKLG